MQSTQTDESDFQLATGDLGKPIPETVPEKEAGPVRRKPGRPAKAKAIPVDPIQAGVDLTNQIHAFNREPSDVIRYLQNLRERQQSGRSGNLGDQLRI